MNNMRSIIGSADISFILRAVLGLCLKEFSNFFLYTEGDVDMSMGSQEKQVHSSFCSAG